MTGERDDALPAEVRALLSAAVADPAMPDYVAIRALAALAGDERIARLTAMGRQFVADVRRRAQQAGPAALLADAPNVLERVLETATRQIVRGAPHGLTMWTVSREAGIPRRTLYNLYASSDELVGACRRRAQTLWRARFEQRVLGSDPRPVRRLFSVVDAIEAWVRSERFRDDEVLRALPSFADDVRADDLREHLAEIDRFATGLALDAGVPAPHAFGAFVATAVAGASAWFDRRGAARAASVTFVERLIARPRAP
jgi:AcrR family transcriptional regulator